MSRKTLLILLSLMLLLAVFAGAVQARPATSAGGKVDQSALEAPVLQDGPGGRDITNQDWVDHLPLALIMTVFVLVVDAYFIRIIIRDRRKNRQNR